MFLRLYRDHYDAKPLRLKNVEWKKTMHFIDEHPESHEFIFACIRKYQLDHHLPPLFERQGTEYIVRSKQLPDDLKCLLYMFSVKK